MRASSGRAIAVVAAVGAILALAGAFAVGKVQYRSPEAINLCGDFIVLLQSRELKRAHGLTAMNDAVGRTLPAFRARVGEEWESHVKGRQVVSMGLRGVVSAQTYADRLHRWMTGRGLDPERQDIDYVLGLDDGEMVRFQVGVVREKQGVWKVDSFQGHPL